MDSSKNDDIQTDNAIFNTPSLKDWVQGKLFTAYESGGTFTATYTPVAGDVVTWKSAVETVSNTTRTLGSMTVDTSKSTNFIVTKQQFVSMKDAGSNWVFQYSVKRGNAEQGFSYLLGVKLRNAL